MDSRPISFRMRSTELLTTILNRWSYSIGPRRKFGDLVSSEQLQSHPSASTPAEASLSDQRKLDSRPLGPRSGSARSRPVPDVSSMTSSRRTGSGSPRARPILDVTTNPLRLWTIGLRSGDIRWRGSVVQLRERSTRVASSRTGSTSAGESRVASSPPGQIEVGDVWRSSMRLEAWDATMDGARI